MNEWKKETDQNTTDSLRYYVASDVNKLWLQSITNQHIDNQLSNMINDTVLIYSNYFNRDISYATRSDADHFWRVCIKHPYIHHIRFTITFMWFYYESKFHFYDTCFCAYRDRYMGATIYDRLFILSVIISLMLHTDHCLESSRQIMYQFMTV